MIVGNVESRALGYSLLMAALVEMGALTLVGWNAHWLAHPQKTQGLDASAFLDAQLVTLPEEHHLVEEKPVRAQPVKAEAVLSKVAGQGRKAKPEEKPITDENQTKAASEHSGAGSLGPTHGPVTLYNPMPSIPSYLQSENLNKTVVIEFFISAQAAVTPHLLSSSGNEELDAIAIETVKKWQFRPAEVDHKPIDAKVRLRIIFEVK